MPEKEKCKGICRSCSKSACVKSPRDEKPFFARSFFDITKSKVQQAPQPTYNRAALEEASSYYDDDPSSVQDTSAFRAMDSVRLGCFHSCRVVCNMDDPGCIKLRSCDECPIEKDRAEISIGDYTFKDNCCGYCAPIVKLHQRRIDALNMGFQYCGECKDFEQSPEVTEIRRIIRLGAFTCSERAANAFVDAHVNHGYSFKQTDVCSLEEGVDELSADHDSVLLVPSLHTVQKELEQNPNFRELETQRFTLPNPILAVARGTGNWSTSRKRTLFTIPSLLPLVREAYDGKLPFKEVVPANSTADAAEKCVKLSGEGYCVVNEMEFGPWYLKPVKILPPKVVTWRLYANR